MKPIKRALRNAEKLTGNLVAAGSNLAKAGEMAVASGQVIARRVALGQAAMTEPANGDFAEFWRMISEKTTAFSAAGTVWLQRSERFAAHAAELAANEMAVATHAMMSMAACRSPATFAAAQTGFASAWCGRAMSHSIEMTAMALKCQETMMAPVLRAVRGNAKRLG
jgi:hypothetical protein